MQICRVLNSTRLQCRLPTLLLPAAVILYLEIFNVLPDASTVAPPHADISEIEAKVYYTNVAFSSSGLGGKDKHNWPRVNLSFIRVDPCVMMLSGGSRLLLIL